MTYRYAALSPSDIPSALSTLRDTPALGIEVTIPKLAQACSLGNIDPQHLGGDAARAAIEDAVEVDLPPDGTLLATVRADADSVGGMAVLVLRSRGVEIAGSIGERVRAIADADKEATGPWPGPRPLREPADMLRTTSVIAHVATDHTRSMDERVSVLAQWLLNGHVEGAKEIEARLLAGAKNVLQALDVEVRHGVAVVTGASRLGLSVGYRHAPVVLHVNPAFQWEGGIKHLKHTVARWNSFQRMDWGGMLAELQQRERGWGGSSSIAGSPQGVGSLLTAEEVTAIIQAHL